VFDKIGWDQVEKPVPIRNKMLANVENVISKKNWDRIYTAKECPKSDVRVFKVDIKMLSKSF